MEIHPTHKGMRWSMREREVQEKKHVLKLKGHLLLRENNTLYGKCMKKISSLISLDGG